MQLHELKTVEPHFTNTWNGDKPVEIRFNDRGYNEGDILWLRQYDPIEAEIMGTGYSGKEMVALVSKILIGEGEFKGLVQGYVMMGIIILKRIGGSK